MRARLLVNPAAGRGRGERLAGRLSRLAAGRGIAVELSSSAADLAERARRAAAEGVERLLVAGGDGTWHGVAQSLARTDTALAPIPVGTGNDLARELRVPFDLVAAFEQGVDGERDRIDLGRLRDEWFCGVAGVGFDAAVADYARSRLRWLRGPLVYVVALIATLPRFRAPDIRIESAERGFDDEAFLVAFANGSHYGGGMRIAPDADPRDGLLDVVVVRRRSKARLLTVFPRVYRGTHLSDPSITTWRTRQARVRVSEAQSINLDGESGGRTGSGEIEVSVAPGALAVVRGEDSH